MRLRNRWKPRQKLLEIREKCYRRRSLKRILPIISEVLECNGNDFRKFSYRFNGHLWKGYIYMKRNSLMGSLFTVWDNKFRIVRGYPKIKYTHDTIVMNKETVVEEKIDGTNLGIWLLPNGKIMGKTRLVERWDLGGYKGRVWSKLFKKTKLEKPLIKLLKDDYEVFGELYGKENKGEFITYSIPIAFKVFDIFDRRSLGFLPYDKKIELAQHFGLPTINLFWQGILSPKEIERIEFELSNYVREDGMEGCVAKFYDFEDKDVYMAKLKCKEIWTLAASLSGSLTIPASIIGKAIQKAIENMAQLKTKDEFDKFIRDELLEEATEELVSKSKQKIKRLVHARLTPVKCQKEVFKYLDELVNKGLDIKHKGKIMSSLASHFLGYNPSILYRVYLLYLGRIKE